MKMSSCQVAIIGAAPYGLAATAHLRSAGLETWTFGQPKEFWQNQMPAGMPAAFTMGRLTHRRSG